MEQTTVYMNKHQNVQDMTYEDFENAARQGKNNKVMAGLHRYAANIPGTDGFWYKHSSELQAAVTSLGCPTLFYTLSMAYLHWPSLLKLLPWPPGTKIESTTFEQRQKLINAIFTNA